MNNDFVKIYETTDNFKAELIKSMLTDCDIDCVIISTKDSAYQMFGSFQLYVHKLNEAKANTLIEKHNE